MYGWGGLGGCPGGCDGVGAWRHGHWQCEGARTVQLRQTCSGWDFPCSPYGQPAGVSVAACDLSVDLLLGLVRFYPGHCGFPRLTVMELRRLSSAASRQALPTGGWWRAILSHVVILPCEHGSGVGLEAEQPWDLHGDGASLFRQGDVCWGNGPGMAYAVPCGVGGFKLATAGWC